MPLTGRACAECGKTFESLHPHARYCSDRCRNAKYGRRAHLNDISRSDVVLTLDPDAARSRRVDANGYVMLRFDQGHVAEHRMVLAQKLGRPLGDAESAHHRNGVRDDNRPDNLELWIGPMRSGARAVDLRCPHCGEAWASA